MAGGGIITDPLSVAIIGGAGIVLIEPLVPGERQAPDDSAYGDVIHLHPEAKRATLSLGREADVARSLKFARHTAHDSGAYTR